MLCASIQLITTASTGRTPGVVSTLRSDMR